MADPSHLQLLTRGVVVWNKWRREFPDITPDLRGANLRSTDLRAANLRAALLCGADITSADLRTSSCQWADLNGAFLCNTNLKDADLTQANFYGAELSGSVLSDANFQNAILTRANLAGANLTRANLTGTKAEDSDFTGANLYGANLDSSDLQGATFAEAILIHANLAKARLVQTRIDQANLVNADFSQSTMAETCIIRCDLREALGLDAVRHELPSSLGLDTIYYSGGDIPQNFLRGCGIPDVFLEYMSSLTGRALEFYSAFISYSSQDKGFAERVHNDLQAAGVRCWFAPEDMPIGAKIRPTIHESIRVYEKLLLILSESALDSAWVEDEVEAALERERKTGQEILFPVRIDDSILESKAGWAASLRRQRHIGDFREWKNPSMYGKAFQRLTRDLQASNQGPETRSDRSDIHQNK